MKKYYIIRMGFANCYYLIWADDTNADSVPVTAERITRAEAISYARQEARRRRENSAFSGYADTRIFPADFDPEATNHQPHRVLDYTRPGPIMDYISPAAQERHREAVKRLNQAEQEQRDYYDNL